MRFDKLLWLFGGTGVILTFGSFVNTFGPLHVLMLAWSYGFWAIAVVPTVYFVSLSILWDSKWLAPFVLSASVAVFMLSVVFFFWAWGEGIRWSGFTYTVIMVLGNAVMLGYILFLAITGMKRRMQRRSVAAFFLLFVLLSFGAFPYLGEPP